VSEKWPFYELFDRPMHSRREGRRYGADKGELQLKDSGEIHVADSAGGEIGRFGTPNRHRGVTMGESNVNRAAEAIRPRDRDACFETSIV
jgi:hypothetical protein